jgi:hypothetical protein
MQMAAESGTSSIFSFNFSPYLPYQAKKQAVLFPIIAQSTDYRNKINKAPLKVSRDASREGFICL